MSVATFLEAPWRTAHRSYEESFLNIRPAPEFSTAEVAVASLYRSVGFPGVSENQVPKAGRELDKKTSKAGKGRKRGALEGGEWRNLLHGVLDSPKQPKQSSKRFLQLTPLVPDATLYSGSARLAGNSWNPGMLVQRLVQMGASSSADAEAAWSEVFTALSVDRGDDVWAQWLQGCLEELREDGIAWALRKLEPFPNDLDELDKGALHFPAKQFVVDLRTVIKSKAWMTRRQWISVVESLVRLGMVSHVLWLASCGARVWHCARLALADKPLPHGLKDDDIRSGILRLERGLLSYGSQAMPAIRDAASAYLESRLGLNLLLWSLAETGLQLPTLSSADALGQFLTAVSTHRKRLLDAGFQAALDQLQAQEARAIACKSGIGSNIIEFTRHTLGQRQTATETLRGYDQGYFLRKRSESTNSPWVLSIGPVAAITMVHCCLGEGSGPRSIQRLATHLSAYGLEIDVDDITSSDLGRKLRMLGLVLDSPDAESGMLLVPPFASAHKGGQS